MNEVGIRAIQRRFLGIKSADIYDVMDSMGYPDQCLDLGIRPLREDMTIAGPAFTILGTRDPLFGKDLDQNHDNFALFDHLYPGCVVVINAEADRVAGHWGGMMSYAARNAGAVGVVIDGGTRDKSEVLQVKDWSCFARYTTPIEADRRWSIEALQRPIYMSGTLSRLVRVNPGDWVVGDMDGVLVIPADIVLEVLNAVEDVNRREKLSVEELSMGTPIREVFKKYQRA
jgi:4-hydroxy-4-methyl-2-oxoglutarate aldolase